MSDNSTLQAYYQEKDAFYFEADRSEMLSFVPLNLSMILEVGCGYGNFARLMKEKCAAQVWGVEIEEQAAAIAAQKIDKVFCSAFDRSLNLPTQKFDCIVFNDVLEHLVDPFSALVYCKELLSKDGIVLASIPNVRYFDNIWKLIVHKDWEYSDFGILDRTHLRFFTRKSILSTFNSLNYQVQQIEGINPLEKEHPHHARKFKLINQLFRNQAEDMRYQQFAVVARLN